MVIGMNVDALVGEEPKAVNGVFEYAGQLFWRRLSADWTLLVAPMMDLPVGAVEPHTLAAVEFGSVAIL